MVELLVRNWRCIEEARVFLAPVTVLVGKNSAGKSSLAYAPYFLVKAVEWGDAGRVLEQLYGVGVDGVVRSRGGDKFYPLVVEAGGSRFEAREAGEYSLPESTPWSTGYLLPSQRISFMRIPQLVSKLNREIRKRSPEARAFLMFTSSILEVLGTMPILPPMYLFLDDLMKLYLGRRFSRRHELGEMGALVEEVAHVLSLITYMYEDPFVELKLPLDLAPDGSVDSFVIRKFADNALEGSLIVVEEPEIHKNPLQIIDLARYLAARAVGRRLTLVMTTHSDLVLHALAKAVEEGEVKASDVAAYYLNRSRESPWTRVKRLEVYEDGTIEELPDSERVVSALF